jgi:ribosomal protein S18 acetylase RimI-like enzyme
MEPSWKIREFDFLGDYEECALIWKNSGGGVQFGPSDTLEEISKKVQYGADLFLVAEINQIIVGTIIGGFDGRRGMIYHLAVLPEYRSRGIASSLLEETENRMRARGCLKMYLFMRPDHPQLLDFYNKFGWNKSNVLVAAKEFRS